MFHDTAMLLVVRMQRKKKNKESEPEKAKAEMKRELGEGVPTHDQRQERNPLHEQHQPKPCETLRSRMMDELKGDNNG